MVRARPFSKAEVSPVAQLEPFTWGISEGILTRNGMSYFWLGNGYDLGAAQSTPLGLWLAKLQGVSMVALYQSARITCDRRADGTVEAGAAPVDALFPWIREAIRLGMLADVGETSGNVTYGFYTPIIKACPAFSEIARFCGHFKALDTNYRAGRELIFAKRAPVWSYGAHTGFFIAELAREPGYDLTNRRGIEGFRSFSRRKYGSIERANAVWNTSYDGFESVVPPHLVPGYVPKPTIYNGGGKFKMQREHPEMWYDFERFLCEDLLASFRGEVEDVRKNIPGLRIGIDFRSHMTPIDDYACYEPALFSPYLDVSFTHDNGFEPFVYEDEGWRRDVLCRETSYALFRLNFFRNNISTPMVDAESIVTGAPVVGSAGESGGYVNDYIRYAKFKPFGERGYAAWLWSYFAGGLNGLMTWSWLHGDYVKPYLPRIVGPLETAARFTMRAVRHRRSDIAFLYPFAWARGLPSISDERGYKYVEWFDALAFLGREPEAYGEVGLADKLDVRRHRVLFAPYCEVTDRTTLELVKDYVERGGRLVVTRDSFRRVFDDWGETDFAAYAAARPDRVTVLDSKSGIAELMAAFRPIVSEPDLKLVFAPSDELPVVHRVLAGDDSHALLYFANYGGRDQCLTATLPEKYGTWRLVPLRGSAKREGNDVKLALPGSLGIFAAVLEAPGAEKVEVEVDLAAEVELKRLDRLYREDPDDPRPKALFPKLSENARRDILCVGKELYPRIVEAYDRRGYATVSASPDTWTPEMLSGYPSVCLVESRGHDIFPEKFFEDGRFVEMLKDYVGNGGRLFVFSWTARTTCANAEMFRHVGAAFGVKLDDKGPAADPVRCSHGDPRQIVANEVSGSPVSQGVSKVQLFALSPFECAPPCKAAVALADGRAAMATLEYGKGRVFFCADPMAFQPYRIEEAGNLRLLENVFDWMIGPSNDERLSRADDGVVYKGMVVHNVADLVPTEDGRLVFRRAGTSVHGALGNQGRRMNESSTGVEFRFVIKGDSVKLRLGGPSARSVSQMRIHYGDIDGDWPNDVRTVIGTDDEIVIPRKNAARRPGDRFDPSVVRLVLPHGNIGIRDVIGDIEPPGKSLLPEKTYLAYGSSITHGSNAYVMEECYASLVGKALDADVRNLGFSGSARMEPEMADFIAAQKFDFATLEMGVNVVDDMPEEEYERRVRYFVRRVAESHPRVRILAIDIFGWTTGRTSDAKAERYRAILRRVVAEIGCPNVTYVNGLDILPDNTEISLGNGVHPTPAGHRLIAENIVSRFRHVPVNAEKASLTTKGASP